MSWVSTVDERSRDGFSRSPDYYDAPNTLNTTYRLAPNSTAYGNLTDAYLLPDEDVYSLGVLSTGHYTLDVDEDIWDFISSNNGYVTKFEILNSLGTVVATSYSTFSDINFTVYDSSTYYARIVGSSFDEQQYTARYYKTGELNTPTIWASTPSLSGNLRAGSTLDVDIDYFDADGNSDEIYFTGWYLDGDYVGASETLTLTDADYGKVVSVEFGLSDDAGNVEVSGLYILGIVNTPTDWDDTASFTGELLAGSTLDASILYADVDGNSDGIYATNWYLDDEHIGTQETITLTPSDYGKTVVVGFALVDDANNFELSGGYLLGRVNTPPTGSVAISGTATQGATLTADTSGLDDPDGLGSFSYQWLRDGSPIAGANAENYVFTQNDVATATTVTVSYTDGGGKVESVTSDPADDVPGETDTEATLGVGQTFNGALESAGDQDWFAVNFVAGQTYLIRMTAGTLLDPLIMVAEATGEIINLVDNGYDGQSEIFVWTAEYTGPGFIVADSYYRAPLSFTQFEC